MAQEKYTGKDQGANTEQINRLVQQKLEISSKIKEMQSEIGKINLQLHQAGADAVMISAW